MKILISNDDGILARGIGGAFIASDVDAAEVRSFLVERLAERC